MRLTIPNPFRETADTAPRRLLIAAAPWAIIALGALLALRA